LSLAACATASPQRDVPAVLTSPTAESRAELLRVVRGALNGRPLTIADDALTRDGALIIERARARGADGQLLNGRDTGKPEHFRLVRNGSRCVLVHESTGKRFTLSSASCASEPAPVGPSARMHDTEKIGTVDAPKVTPGGVAYTAPAGWRHSARGAIVILAPAEEDDAHLAIVDATATEPDAAVAEGWKLFGSTPAPTLKLAVDAPAREGWDQIRRYDYETSPNEKRSVFATAFRRGTKWTVALLDSSDATLGKRRAAIGLVADSIRPKGYTKESFAGKAANRLDAARLAKIGEMIEQGRAELGIPGVSIAIVQDGTVIHARGYGVRELGKDTPVDADSLYIIASNTKALTTLLLATLVDDGKLRWDQPVTEVYPEFKLGDAATTAATRIEHLVCACTGLPRKDFDWLFEFAKATPLTEMKYLAGVQPTTKFGETYQYSNLLAAAAGFTAAHVLAPEQELGLAYDAAMKARVFGPLGMTTTTFAIEEALRSNHASPHSWDIDARTRVTPMDLNHSIYPLRPAGAAWSSANELIRYVQMELARGVAPGGKRVVSEENLMKRRQPYVAVGEDATYGMGLFVSRKYGIPVIDHGGSMIGFKSNMMWLPDHGVGAVVLTNSDLGYTLHSAFQRFLLEQLFDGRPEALEDLKAAAKTARQGLAAERPRLTVPADAAAVAALARHYENDALGAIDVKTSGAATFDFGEWRSDVASRNNDDGTVSFVAITPGQDGFQFVVGKAPDGRRALTLRDAQHEYVFVEAPEVKPAS
jgi:CubicO group peptidase (beta-lactamase class C family)